MKNPSLKICVLAVALFTTAPVGADSPCGQELEGPVYSEAVYQDLFDAHDNQREPSDKYLAIFHRQGLPELQRFAIENDLTIAELIKDLHAAQTIFYEEATLFSAKTIATLMKNFSVNFQGIEKLIGRPKLKAAHYLKLKSYVSTLQMAGQLVARGQLAQRGVTNINPFGPLDRKFVAALLAGVEDGALDEALNEVASWVSDDDELAEDDDDNTAPAEPPPTAPELALAPPAPAAIGPEAEHANEIDLGRVLHLNLPLSSTRAYQANPARGIPLNVRLDDYLVKQSRGNHEGSIRRLLRALLIGSERAGVRSMSDIGPRIVEITGVFHGHKRLIGCLSGVDLTLLHMVDIKEQRATYFKRIPRDLCKMI